ncbi:MAG: hypothetical protein KDA21_07905 [Phycisphaerales bacterium]|nr:hypothetical protein [Phycisphaerales bacterium]
MVAETRVMGTNQDAEGRVWLNREQLIDRIRTLNPTAAVEFLARFDVDALLLYLDHLVVTESPRCTREGWIRPADSRAIGRRSAREAVAR